MALAQRRRTVSLVDTGNETESHASFRKGKPLSTGTVILSMRRRRADATHWTAVAQEPARDGDGKEEWLPRNRTILKHSGWRGSAS